MKRIALRDQASVRQAFHALEPDQYCVLYADAAKTKLVAQGCRTQEAYYVVGPRFDGGIFTVDQIVETGQVALYNMGQADNRAHIYRFETLEETLVQLQRLFKQNRSFSWS